ncbi:hypothetical protein A2U01_0038001 [Trifolium medium]|uniref:Uncharacterized protein n=1 Tax=Trifolium medium TaxID=97028 RepID=A0A392PYQ5_9FABA|nr:hypothetical protein [Trifolium medium]
MFVDLREYCGDLWGWGRIFPRDGKQGWGQGTNLRAGQGAEKHPSFAHSLPR